MKFKSSRTGCTPRFNVWVIATGFVRTSSQPAFSTVSTIVFFGSVRDILVVDSCIDPICSEASGWWNFRSLCRFADESVGNGQSARASREEIFIRININNVVQLDGCSIGFSNRRIIRICKWRDCQHATLCFINWYDLVSMSGFAFFDPLIQRHSLFEFFFTAGQMACYDQVKQFLRVSCQLPENAWSQLLAVFSAGLITTTLTSPSDVVKTRMMNQSKHTSASSVSISAAPVYRGTIDCFRQIIRNEGFSALFKGWTSNYARQGPQTMIILTVTEALRALFGMPAL